MYGFEGPMSESYENCDKDCARSCAAALLYPGEDRDNMVLNLDDSINLGPSMCEPNKITINWSDVDDNGDATTLATDVLYDGDIATPVKAATYPGKTFVGWRFVKPDSGEEEGGSGGY